MLEILKLNGVQKLERKQQKSINGGVCPQQGEYCVPGIPIHCITADPYLCINNKWVKL
ncbi:MULTISPECIES: hypothetical protein [Tenacibaculum]|uniref:hypothetical protein n=1 Tax=Tenacibaculum TaxID=104267 RepID=UPI0008952A86|nr:MULTISPECIES: hypothetical protein [unclassified Tenacibaculum]SEE61344.1 hypothetical protein SAMN04487765_3392 [Tenacibaculum sp. MAR_2010_89]